MAETKTRPSPKADPEAAPGAETATPTMPNRARRYSFYQDGNDYVLLSVQVNPETGEPVPNGALAAVPDVPRFASAAEAKKWIQNSGAQLQGMTVLVVRMHHKVRVAVENKPQVTIIEDPRFERQATETADSEE